MIRVHRLGPAIAAALATAALLAPVAQARPTVAGAASGGGGGVIVIDRHAHDTPLANPVSVPATTPVVAAGAAKQNRDSGGGGTDWNAVFAGAAGSALIIAMCAAGLSLVRRRTVTA